jgi:hypothetical protein
MSDGREASGLPQPVTPFPGGKVTADGLLAAPFRRSIPLSLSENG